MKEDNLKKWITLNKKELLESYEEYLKDMLEINYNDLEYILNFEKFCKFQKDYYKNNYEEVF